MKPILSDQLLEQVISALANGENFKYEDENTKVYVAPNGVSITYNSTQKTNTQDEEVTTFLKFCETLPDDLFIETCESFKPGELEGIQEALDTEKYRDAIVKFTNRVREVAKVRLDEITTEADNELKRQELIIAEAQASIESIRKDLEEAIKTYTL